MKIRALFLIASAVVSGALILSGVSAATASALDSYGIGAVPANPREDVPRSKSIFVYEADKNEAVEDAIKVINNSKEERSIRVYPVDSQRSSDGAFSCEQAVEDRDGVGGWLKLEKETTTLDAGESEDIPFTLNVPKNADVGEHNGCIAIEDANPDKADKEASGNGIVLSFRSAIRVAVVVPGDINANLSFKSVDTKADQDSVTVSPTLSNEGNVSVDANIAVALTDYFGNEYASDSGTFAVLNGDESKFNFKLGAPFWGGWYKVSANSEYQILNPSGGDQGEAKTVRANESWLYVTPQPLALLLYVVALLLLVVGIVWLVIRHRNEKLLHQRMRKYKVMEGDNLQSIAQKYESDWKLLARVNGLKPPYVIATGDTIKVPLPKSDKRSAKQQGK